MIGYYRVKSGDSYLCGVQYRGIEYWGEKWAASETPDKNQAEEWRVAHGGDIEMIGYYRVKSGDSYLCGVQYRGIEYWGEKWAASETPDKNQAEEWRVAHGGDIEMIEPMNERAKI